MCDEATRPMKEYGSIPTLHAADTYCNKIFTTDIKNEVTTRMTRILDSKYKKANIAKVVADSRYLTTDEQSKLLAVLHRYEKIFDGGLGLWKTTPVKLELKPDAVPYHAKPYPILWSCRKETTRKEIKCLCSIGVLEKSNDSKWGAPTFIIPKKNGMVRLISDFRVSWKSDSSVNHFHFQKFKISCLSLRAFSMRHLYTSICMAYYHIELNLLAQARNVHYCPTMGQIPLQMVTHGGGWFP